MTTRVISNRVLNTKDFKNAERSMTSRGLLYLSARSSSSSHYRIHLSSSESSHLYSLLLLITEPWGRWRSGLIQDIYERPLGAPSGLQGLTVVFGVVPLASDGWLGPC